MRKLAFAFAIGASSIVVFGCSTAPEPRKGEAGARDPVAVAKVSSTKSTLRLTNATTWRIYGGQTQVVIMGFGKDKKPIDGMRVRINPDAKEATDTWLSLESLKKSGGVMELGLNNKVLIDTTTPTDKKVFHGALRAAAAYAKKKTGAGVPVSSSSSNSGDAVTGGGVTSAKSRLVAFANTCALADVMSTVASCSGQRPACKKDPKGTLMCGITSVQCAADANRAMVACAKQANATGGAAVETKKNPPPKKASLPIPKLPGSLGGGSSSSSGTGAQKSSGSAGKTSSGSSKSGGSQTSGGKGGEEPCDEEFEECGGGGGCDPDDDTCDGTDPMEDDDENPEEIDGDEKDGEEDFEGVDDEDIGDGDFDDEGDFGDFDDDVDADPFGDEGFPEDDFGDADFGGDDFGDADFGGDDFGGDFESYSPKLQTTTTRSTPIKPKTVTPTVMSSASCGRSRVLQCGSRSSMTFCRCVSK
jgi:hypothetical protein